MVNLMVRITRCATMLVRTTCSTLIKYARTSSTSATRSNGALHLAPSVQLAVTSVKLSHKRLFARFLLRDRRMTSAHSTMAASQACQTSVIPPAPTSMTAHYTGRIALLDQTGTSARVSPSYVSQLRVNSGFLKVVTIITNHQVFIPHKICLKEFAVSILPSTVQTECIAHLRSGTSAKTGALLCSPLSISLRSLSRVCGLSAEPTSDPCAQQLARVLQTIFAPMAGPSMQISAVLFPKDHALRDEKTSNRAPLTSTLAWRHRDTISAMTSHLSANLTQSLEISTFSLELFAINQPPPCRSAATITQTSVSSVMETTICLARTSGGSHLY